MWGLKLAYTKSFPSCAASSCARAIAAANRVGLDATNVLDPRTLQLSWRARLTNQLTAVYVDGRARRRMLDATRMCRAVFTAARVRGTQA